ncbi:MAG: hypothetical protein OEY14_09245 [Myxococcales bacterium]|nr:hypothetical protein [Myxococcales bacterium]
MTRPSIHASLRLGALLGTLHGALLGGLGCAETGQDHVALPLYVAGEDVSAGLMTSDAIPVTLDRAELAFGPLTICAGEQAGDLCETARLEWLGSVVVDALDPEPALAGELAGITGPVRSWMYDLGLSSLLTQEAPLALDAALELGGVSLILEGSAELPSGTLPFSAAIAIQQEEATELGVPVVRKSASDVFEHEVREDEPGLLIRFDPSVWMRGVDFRGALEDRPCLPEGPPIVCAGSLEQRCAPDGSVQSATECASAGQHCLAGIGCADALQIEPNTQAYRSLRNALVSGERPRFEWGFRP